MKDLQTSQWVATTFPSGPERGCWLDVYTDRPQCAGHRLAVQFEHLDAVAAECFLRMQEDPFDSMGEKKMGYVVWPETRFVRVEPVISRPF